MEILVVGCNHTTAPVEVRERLDFPEGKLPPALEALMATGALQEGMILSTCNRVEVWGSADDPYAASAAAFDFLVKARGVDPEELRPCLYTHRGLEAVRHLFRVASSLDSMVVGEPQILGQLKAAYALAQSREAAGNLLSRAMHHAFRTAKRVRTETGIGRNAVSVSYAAVELARKIFDSLTGKVVLLLGAGEMAELAAKHLVVHGVAPILVANRTWERAQELARAFGGKAIRYDEFAAYLIEADIVLCSTGAPHFVVTRERVQQCFHARRHRPMFLIDIAVPRNIEPTVNELDDVYLYDIDDLQHVVEANAQERLREAERARELVEQEVVKFAQRLSGQDVVPTIKSLQEKLEEIRQGEVVKTLGRLKDAPPETRAAIEAMSSAIVSKILHGPIQQLKASHRSHDGPLFRKLVHDLFGLGPEEPEVDPEFTDDELPK